MSGKSITFDDKKNREIIIFTKAKKYLDIDIDKILVLKKETYGTNKSFKHFKGYSDGDDIKTLCIKLFQMIGCVKHFESNKTMSFKVVDNKLLRNILKQEEKLVVSLIKHLIVNLFMGIVINT